MSNGYFLKLIGYSRFPLICLVVLSHSLGFSFEPVMWNDFSEINIYNFITQMLSHNYAKIAVCLFFFYSGYLFFRGTDKFSWKWCLNKWMNRIKTLLIPFVLWNILSILAIVIKNCIFGIWGYYSPDEMGIVSWGHVLDWFRIPADFPLWYMEDLMFMVLMAPLAWVVFSKLRLYALILLILVYLSPLDPGSVSMRAIFFFSLGALCSINKIDVYNVCRKIRIPSHILAVATLLLCTFHNSMSSHEFYLRLFYPFGMISFLNILDSVTTRWQGAGTKLNTLAGTTFFIYAAHEIYVLGWTKGACLRLFGESIPAMYVRYFLVPAIVVFVCFLLYELFKRIAPKPLTFICGGRVS